MANTTKIDEKIKSLAEKLKAQKALKQKVEAAERAAASKKLRAEDTRKKILLGAYCIEQMLERGEPLEILNLNGIILSDWVRRDDDRALFGLAPLPKAHDGN